MVSSREGVVSKKQRRRRRRRRRAEIIREVVLPDLPFSVICDILSRLPMEEIMRYRCVCKTWCELPKDSYFIQLHSSRSETPYVAVHNVKTGRTQSLFQKNTSNGRWREMKIPPKDDKDISRGLYNASCHGLVCITQSYNCNDVQPPDIIYNPITREEIRLPEFQCKDFIDGIFCGFGFDKISNNYKLILEFFSDVHVLPIITLGESSWRYLDTPYEIFCKRKGEALFFDGGFHWAFGRYGRHVYNNNYSLEGILTFDINSEKFQTTFFSSPLELDKHVRLIQLGNSMALFQPNYLDTKPKVFKIWKILGANGDGSSLQYQFETLTLKMAGETIPFTNSYHFHLHTILSNGDFIFTARDVFGNRTDVYLVVYNQEKDEPSYEVELMGNFMIGTFLPTLISPPCSH